MSNTFGVSDNQFIKTYRLDRASALDLIDELIGLNVELNPPYCSGIPFALIFLAVLNFFSHGCYHTPTSMNRFFPMSQSSVSRSLKSVTDELNKLGGKYIKFPKNREEIASAKLDFMVKLQMPGIIGALDGCHIALFHPPAVSNGYLYFNRKRFYSINTLFVCDANLRISYVNANFPGSVHDSAVWSTSEINSVILLYC